MAGAEWKVERTHHHALSNSGARGHLTASAFVPWIIRIIVRRIVVAGIAGRTWRDPLLKFFDI
jgi:hypothetical protein